jgi:hypothetical protein
MSNPKTITVFEDLEAYTAFCREYGYKVKPEHLYNKSSRIWRLYSQRYLAGKPVRNMWEIDGQKYEKRKYYKRR